MLDDEKYIIINHYGLNGLDPRTMADIGKVLIFRERVRQIEVGAFLRLRNYSKTPLLKNTRTKCKKKRWNSVAFL